jgi:hypothetical protein
MAPSLRPGLTGPVASACPAPTWPISPGWNAALGARLRPVRPSGDVAGHRSVEGESAIRGIWKTLASFAKPAQLLHRRRVGPANPRGCP